jgi:EAL domain-containing protein (putative c-di-GMP-specific phosphodiesterase class I)
MADGGSVPPGVVVAHDDRRAPFLAALSDAVLRDALAAGQFEITYQPILALDDWTMAGAEALLRWRHPEFGVIEPDRFIPFAEQNEAIVDISRWAVSAVCDQNMAWQAAGAGSFPISVNVSPAQFDRADFVEGIIAALDRSGLAPTALELEITENMFMPDLVRTGAMLSRLSDIGVRLAVDDFGTGFTSLDYLHRLPVQKLKIDKSFVDGIDTDPHDAAVAGAIIRIGQSFSLRVVAEGVETAAQVDRLRELGCDDVQGYYAAPPMQADEFVVWLEGHRRLARPGRDITKRS